MKRPPNYFLCVRTQLRGATLFCQLFLVEHLIPAVTGLPDHFLGDSVSITRIVWCQQTMTLLLVLLYRLENASSIWGLT